MGDDPLQVRADRLRLAGGPAVVLELGAVEHPLDLPAGDRAQRIDPDAGLDREAQVGDGRVAGPAVGRVAGPDDLARGDQLEHGHHVAGAPPGGVDEQVRDGRASTARSRRDRRRRRGRGSGGRRDTCPPASPSSRPGPGSRGRRGSGSARDARGRARTGPRPSASSSVKPSARGCSLIPRAPRSRQRTASATASDSRVDPGERDESIGGARGGLEHRVVRRRVAVRLVHREGHGSCADRLERCEQLVGVLLVAVGVVAAEVGVGVVEDAIAEPALIGSHQGARTRSIASMRSALAIDDARDPLDRLGDEIRRGAEVEPRRTRRRRGRTSVPG